MTNIDIKPWSKLDYGLDNRLVKALSKLGFNTPTHVQMRSIPIALQGKDILVRARTGSGKTICFAIPLLNKLLNEKERHNTNHIYSLILAPTKELCKQIEKQINDLCYYCRDIITMVTLTDDNNDSARNQLQHKPDILIATPTKVLKCTKDGSLDISNIKLLVIDEADLVLSFGYEKDVNYIISQLPKIFQGILISATLSTRLEKFKKVVLHNPIMIKLDETETENNLLQFYIETTEKDKYLILYVFLKLSLLQGKGLIFVNDINKGYKVKLFLQQFFINSAVLNAELPLNSRLHIMEEYNRGIFDLLIATDACFDSGNSESNDNTTTTNQGKRKEIYEDEENDVDEDEEDDDVNADDDDEEDNDKNDENDVEDEDEDKDDDDASKEESDNENGNKEEEEEDLEGVEWMTEEDGNNDSKNKINKKTTNDNSNNNKQHKKLIDNDEYGVARGIDFQDVSYVINFDFPKSAAGYTHRIGRTARGSKIGSALSFVSKIAMSGNYSHKKLSSIEIQERKISDRDYYNLHEVRQIQPRLNIQDNESLLATIQSQEQLFQSNTMNSSTTTTTNSTDDHSRMQPVPLNFNMKELDHFRYRVEDTLRSVTAVAVKEFRTAEIKREILNSKKLKNYFSDNPNDLKVLRHDKAILHPIVQKPHLKAVPSYLIPMSMKSVATIQTKKSKKRKLNTHGQTIEKRIMKSKMNDPLYQSSSTTQNTVGDVDMDDNNDDDNEGKGVEGGGGVDEQAEEEGSRGGGTRTLQTTEVDNTEEKRVYSSKEVSNLGRSSAGRRDWQARHKKGKYNVKHIKKNSHLTPGTFLKPKKMK